MRPNCETESVFKIAHDRQALGVKLKWVPNPGQGIPIATISLKL